MMMQPMVNPNMTNMTGMPIMMLPNQVYMPMIGGFNQPMMMNPNVNAMMPIEN